MDLTFLVEDSQAVMVVVVVAVEVVGDPTNLPSTLLIRTNLPLTLRFPIRGLPVHPPVLPVLPILVEEEAAVVVEVAEVAEVVAAVHHPRRSCRKVPKARRVLLALRVFRYMCIIPNST